MESWLEALPLVTLIILFVSFAIFNTVKTSAGRIEQLEITHHHLVTELREQVESLQAEVSDLRHLLKDLADFQKGDGRYRYDPDDPRLPAHIRDREGRDD